MPWLNILSVLLLIGLTVVWAVPTSGRGMFSALLASIGVIAAGAVAFGVWELVTREVFLDLHEPTAYTLGLLIPFIVALVIIRVTTDLLVRGNVKVGDVPDLLGGAVCGAPGAFVSTGILVIAFSHLPVGKSLLAHQAIDNGGESLTYKTDLWVPVDTLTAAFYEHLSLGAFSTGTPLAVYNPDVVEASAMARTSYERIESNSFYRIRHTVQPDDVSIDATYRIENSNLNELLADRGFDPESGDVVYDDPDLEDVPIQEVFYADGERVRSGDYLYGLIATFQSSAGEKSGESAGQLIMTPGQVRLIVRKPGTDDAKGVHPFAVIAPSGIDTANRLTRFPLRAGDVIPSVGGTQVQVTWAFEFIVPSGYEAISVFIKNARYDLRGVSPTAVESTLARDNAIAEQTFFQNLGAGAAAINVDLDGAEEVTNEELRSDNVFSISLRIPSGYTPQTRDASQLTHDKGERFNSWTGGTQVFGNTAFANLRGLAQNLMITHVASDASSSIIWARLWDSGDRSVLTQQFERARRDDRFALRGINPDLDDDPGKLYPPIGYIFDNGSGQISMSFEPGRPILSVGELQRPSNVAQGVTYYLIYRVDRGSHITHLVVGDEATLEFDPPYGAR